MEEAFEVSQLPICVVGRDILIIMLGKIKNHMQILIAGFHSSGSEL